MHFRPNGNKPSGIGKAELPGAGQGERARTADNDATADPAGSTNVNRNTAAKAGGSIVVALGAQPFDQGHSHQQPTDQRILDRQIQAAIGEQLRAFYNDVVAAPVPDSFIRLLDELEAKADKR